MGDLESAGSVALEDDDFAFPPRGDDEIERLVAVDVGRLDAAGERHVRDRRRFFERSGTRASIQHDRVQVPVRHRDVDVAVAVEIRRSKGSGVAFDREEWRRGEISLAVVLEELHRNLVRRQYVEVAVAVEVGERHVVQIRDRVVESSVERPVVAAGEEDAELRFVSKPCSGDDLIDSIAVEISGFENADDRAEGHVVHAACEGERQNFALVGRAVLVAVLSLARLDFRLVLPPVSVAIGGAAELGEQKEADGNGCRDTQARTRQLHGPLRSRQGVGTNRETEHRPHPNPGVAPLASRNRSYRPSASDPRCSSDGASVRGRNAAGKAEGSGR